MKEKQTTSIVWKGMNRPESQKYMTEFCCPDNIDDDDDDDDVLVSERADATIRK